MDKREKELLIVDTVGDVPTMMNMFINGDGIKEGWNFYGTDRKTCVVTPLIKSEDEAESEKL